MRYFLKESYWTTYIVIDYSEEYQANTLGAQAAYYTLTLTDINDTEACAHYTVTDSSGVRLGELVLFYKQGKAGEFQTDSLEDEICKQLALKFIQNYRENDKCSEKLEVKYRFFV